MKDLEREMRDLMNEEVYEDDLDFIMRNRRKETSDKEKRLRKRRQERRRKQRSKYDGV